MLIEGSWSALYTYFYKKDSIPYGDDKSFQFFEPTEGRGYVFQKFNMGASSSRWDYYTIMWDRFDNKYLIDYKSLPFAIKPTPCMNEELTNINFCLSQH